MNISSAARPPALCRGGEADRPNPVAPASAPAAVYAHHTAQGIQKPEPECPVSGWTAAPARPPMCRNRRMPPHVTAQFTNMTSPTTSSVRTFAVPADGTGKMHFVRLYALPKGFRGRLRETDFPQATPGNTLSAVSIFSVQCVQLIPSKRGVAFASISLR